MCMPSSPDEMTPGPFVPIQNIRQIKRRVRPVHLPYWAAALPVQPLNVQRYPVHQIQKNSSLHPLASPFPKPPIRSQIDLPSSSPRIQRHQTTTGALCFQSRTRPRQWWKEALKWCTNLISPTCNDSLIPGFTSIAKSSLLQGHSGPLDFLANLTQSMRLVLHRKIKRLT